MYQVHRAYNCHNMHMQLSRAKCKMKSDKYANNVPKTPGASTKAPSGNKQTSSSIDTTNATVLSTVTVGAWSVGHHMAPPTEMQTGTAFARSRQNARYYKQKLLGTVKVYKQGEEEKKHT